MKRLLTSVLCFLLVINFFRTINSAGFLGSSEVLERLDDFEIDLTPINNLVAFWKDNNYGNNISQLSSDLSGQGEVSFGDAGVMLVPEAGGGENSGGGTFGDDESLTWLESIWNSITSIGSIFTSFGNLFSNMQSAISNKVTLLFDTLSFVWNNGIALIMIPIQLISETFSFSLWLLGFGG